MGFAVRDLGMYAISEDAQLKTWAEDGVSLHLHGERGICVPDFSCCNRSLLASPDVRAKYLAGTSKERDAFNVQFLTSMLVANGYVVRTPER